MIRDIRPSDADELVNMAYAMHKESLYCKLDFNTEICYTLFFEWIQNESFFMICDEKDGKIRGSFIARLVLYPYGKNDIIAKDIMLYVKPKYRGTSIAVRMIAEYEKWAEKNNAKRICLEHSCGMNLDRMFKGLGFEPYAKTFKKGV